MLRLSLKYSSNPKMVMEIAGMDAEFGRWLATLGVGGVLAAFMFHFYRKDMKTYTELWRGQSEMLMHVVKENTASNAHLNTMVDALHRRLDDNHSAHEHKFPPR